MLTTLRDGALMALAAHPGHDGNGPGHGGMMGNGFGWWVVLIPLLWIVVIVVLFAVLFAIFGRRLRRPLQGGGDHPGLSGAADAAGNAERTLAERFAQGDIDEVEYRARLEVLRANRPVPQSPPA